MSCSSCRQSLTAIYVASPISEWQAVDSGPMEEGGCAQRSAGTGIAGSIMPLEEAFLDILYYRKADIYM